MTAFRIHVTCAVKWEMIRRHHEHWSRDPRTTKGVDWELFCQDMFDDDDDDQRGFLSLVALKVK